MEKVRHVTVPISKTLTLDAYEFPDGDARIGVTSASLLLGYPKNYFQRLPKNSKKKFKALQGEGFTGYQHEASVIHEQGRGSRVKTISLTDLSIWIQYEAKHGNKTAFDLATSLLEETLEERVNHARGFQTQTVEEKIETLDERRARICRETAAAFSDEEWRESSAPGADFEPTEWESRILYDDWLPQESLMFRTQDEIENFIIDETH